MAITTLDGVAAGMRPPVALLKSNSQNTMPAGSFRSLWYSGAGDWPAASANSSGLSGAVCTSSTTGALVYANPPTGNSYLASVKSAATTGQATNTPLILCDRLWHNSGLDRTATTAQTVNSVTWPARDINGSTNGEGVYIGVEISTTMGTGTPTVTMTYTNSAGVSGRTSSNVLTVSASSTISAFYVLGLAAGDTGVRSVQSIQFSATWGTVGVLHLVAFRPLTFTDYYNVSGAYGVANNDAVTLGLPRLYDNTCLMACAIFNGTNTTTLTGAVNLTQG